MLLEEMINMGHMFLNSRCVFSKLLYTLTAVHWLGGNKAATWHHNLNCSEARTVFVYWAFRSMQKKNKKNIPFFYLKKLGWYLLLIYVQCTFVLFHLLPMLSSPASLAPLWQHTTVFYWNGYLKKKNSCTSAVPSNSAAVLLHAADAVGRRRPLHLLLILHCFFFLLSLFQDVFVSDSYPR